VEKNREVFLQSDGRMWLFVLLGFSHERGKHVGPRELGPVPMIQQVMPSKQWFLDVCGHLPMNQPERLDIFKKFITAARAQNGFPHVSEFHFSASNSAWDRDPRRLDPKTDGSNHVFADTQANHRHVIVSKTSELSCRFWQPRIAACKRAMT
jgi:hypothetical protein